MCKYIELVQSVRSNDTQHSTSMAAAEASEAAAEAAATTATSHSDSSFAMTMLLVNSSVFEVHRTHCPVSDHANVYVAAQNSSYRQFAVSASLLEAVKLVVAVGEVN